jgi:glycosyltransferase 2 family protein
MRRWLTVVVVVLVVVALGVALARGWGTVSKYDWRLEPGWFALGALLFGAAYVMNGLAYCAAVEWLSPVHPNRRVALSIWMRSLLGRYIPGNVMLVVGRAVMAHDHGVPKRATVTATIYEQFLALGIGTVAAVGFLAGYGNPGDSRLLWLLLVVPVILVCLHPVPFRKLSTWALRRTGRPPLDALYSGRQVLKLVILYATGTAVLLVGIWALLRSAAGPEIGGVIEIGLAFMLAFVASFVAFILPSGIGVRDGIMAVVLARHVPGEVALALSVGLRFVMTLLELAVVGLTVLVGRTR